MLYSSGTSAAICSDYELSPCALLIRRTPQSPGIYAPPTLLSQCLACLAQPMLCRACPVDARSILWSCPVRPYRVQSMPSFVQSPNLHYIGSRDHPTNAPGSCCASYAPAMPLALHTPAVPLSHLLLYVSCYAPMPIHPCTRLHQAALSVSLSIGLPSIAPVCCRLPVYLL